jgi:hypothetical protein
VAQQRHVTYIPFQILDLWLPYPTTKHSLSRSSVVEGDRIWLDWVDEPSIHPSCVVFVETCTNYRKRSRCLLHSNSRLVFSRHVCPAVETSGTVFCDMRQVGGDVAFAVFQ